MPSQLLWGPFLILLTLLRYAHMISGSGGEWSNYRAAQDAHLLEYLQKATQVTGNTSYLRGTELGGLGTAAERGLFIIYPSEHSEFCTM